MSISPESRISRIPRIAMTGVALLSMVAIKAEIKHSTPPAARHEMALPIDTRLTSYTINMSSKLVRDSIDIHISSEPKPAVTLTPAELAASETTSLEFKEWSRVDVCEENGNWRGGAPGFNGLGESAKNWDDNGGQQFAPYGYEATPDEQIVEARKIQKNPPDQNGYCEPW